MGARPAPAERWTINLFGVFRARQDRSAASSVAVAVEIFRHGMDDDVRAELDGALEIRTEECVVDDERDAAFGSQLAKRREVRDSQSRVRRSFHVQHLCVWAERAEHGVLRRCVDKSKFKAEVNQELRGQAEDSAVNGFGDYRVIARTKQAEDSVNGGHAGSKYIGALTAFQFGDGALQSFAIRMIGSRVVVAFVFAELGLDIR